MEILTLEGPPARSAFRLRKLAEQLGLPDDALYAQYVHLLAVEEPLTGQSLERAQALLRYGPETGLPVATGELVATVVPRAGTISPWSSKATDIFAICGLARVSRVERGVRWFAAQGWPRR